MWCDNVQGWLRDEERDHLNKLAREKEQLILEIGSFAGKSALAMVENTNSVIVTLDGFRGNTGTDKAEFDKINMEDIKKSIVNSIDKYKVKRIITIPLASTEVIKWWHQPIDGLFMDGDHTTTALDIDGKFIDFVKPNGWIAFHDCTGNDVTRWVNKHMINDKFIKVEKVRTLIVFRRK